MTNNSKDHVLETIEGYSLLRSDIPTRNGRLYTDECLQNIAYDLREFIDNRVPIVTTQPDDDYCVNMDYACGVITKAEIKDHVLYTDIDILDLPAGRILFNRPMEERVYFGPFALVESDKDLVKAPDANYNIVKNLQLNYIEVLTKDPYFKD